MIYKKNMLCKHFKGKSLLEKNIYKIIELDVKGKDIDLTTIIYTGEYDVNTAQGLVVYQNIFEDSKLFAREYYDMSSTLSKEKQEDFNQQIRVQPLTDEEIKTITDKDFITKKIEIEKTKHK